MIDFTHIPHMALDFMNEDHCHFVELANQLEGLLTDSGSEPLDITSVLEQLLGHCREHFGREERQMLLYVFPPYLVHKGEHERVLAGLELAIAQWRQSLERSPLLEYVAALPEWFVHHVATMDTVTANYIVKMGGPAEC